MEQYQGEGFAKIVEKYIAHLEELEKTGADVPEVRDFEESMRQYWSQHPDYVENLGWTGKTAGSKTYEGAINTTDPNVLNLVEVGSKVSVPQGGCEVCVYVLENKEQHQPFLCRGLKSPAYQQSCVSVLVSLMWWLENQVYWVNYGCQRQGASNNWEWVKPCPAHAICSFIQSLYDRSSFCPEDAKFRKPTA